MTSINKNSNILLRLSEWSKDRFPIPNFISGALSFITMILIGRFLNENQIVALTQIDLIGIIAFVGHLLVLRVFDEHKDYKVDLINHPERVLSKGVITLTHLKYLALPFPMIAIFWSYLADQSFGPTFFVWLLMFIYSVLMAKEFFIGKYLTKNLFIYSLSHMLVSPIMVLWPITAGLGKIDLTIPLIQYTLFISLASGLAYELTRKTRGQDEDKNLDSYNKSFGTKISISYISLLNLMTFILGYLILEQINSSLFYPKLILFIGYTCTFYPTFNFLKKQTQKSRKVNEGGIGLYFLFLYVAILITLIKA